MQEILSGRLRVEPDQVMGHSGLKTDSTSHYSTLQSFTPDKTDSWLSKSLLRSQTACRVSSGLGKSSQQKQTTQTWVTLIVKFDSVFMKLCVCGENSNLQSQAIRPVFVESSHKWQLIHKNLFVTWSYKIGPIARKFSYVQAIIILVKSPLISTYNEK